MTTSVLIPADHLRAAHVWAAAAAAGTDVYLPALTNVQIILGQGGGIHPHPPHYGPAWDLDYGEASRTYVTITATDRYRLHWARIDLGKTTGGDQVVAPTSLVVPAAALSAILKSYPLHTDADRKAAQVRLGGPDPSMLRVEANDADPASPPLAEFTLPLSQDEFPKVLHIIPTKFSDDAATQTLVDPSFLGQAARLLGRKADLAMHMDRRDKPITLTEVPSKVGGAKPSVRRSALLMPKRVAE